MAFCTFQRFSFCFAALCFFLVAKYLLLIPVTCNSSLQEQKQSKAGEM